MAEKKKKLSDFEAPSVTDWIAQFGAGAVGPGDVQPATHILSELLGGTIQSLTTLPERAFRAASGVRQGEYDPGPVLEAAMLPMGATPFSAPRGAIGAGLTSPAPKKMDPSMAAALEQAGIKPGVPLAPKKVGDPVEEALSKIAAALKEGAPTVSKKDPLWLQVLKESKPTADKPTLAKGASGLTPASKGTRLGKIEANFEPLDWQGTKSIYSTPASVEIPPRAAELGFNPSFPLFKGRASERPAVERSLPDPSAKDFERGLFFAGDPGIARAYGPVTEYVARAKSPVEIDWTKVSGGDVGYNGILMHDIVETARAAGHDFLKVKGIRDMGSPYPQDQFVVINPALVRSPKAAFDPARINENDLLAGLASVGMLGGLAGLGSERRQ